MDFWFGKTQGIFKHSFKYRIFKHLFKAASGLSLLIITFNLKPLKKDLKKDFFYIYIYNHNCSERSFTSPVETYEAYCSSVSQAINDYNAYFTYIHIHLASIRFTVLQPKMFFH